jgi:hypothetical protein
MAVQEKSLVIVSGLPRSGTSMMMKMLSAGGLEAVADNRRQADEDNLLGYFEDQRVMNLAGDSSWITPDLAGKVIKVISMLLYHLPPELSYKVVFMRRSLVEILASQRKMLERRGEMDTGPGDEVMAAKFDEHLQKVYSWLDDQKNFQALYVDYAAAVESPQECAVRVKKFLAINLNLDAMTEAVQPRLYRNRAN